MKVTIEFFQTYESKIKHPGWCVSSGDKYADGLSYDEMIGLVSQITMPEIKHTLQWLRTAKEHKVWSKNLSKRKNNE